MSTLVHSIGAPDVDGASSHASTPGISTPSLEVSQADVPISHTAGTTYANDSSSSYSDVTYDALHAPDPSASFF